jgi:hypothetical protein
LAVIVSLSAPDPRLAAILAAVVVLTSGLASAGPLDSLSADSRVVPFENVEGLMLAPARLRSYPPGDSLDRGRVRGSASTSRSTAPSAGAAAAGIDTTGPMVVDTGAGYPAIDRALARALAIDDGTGDPTVLALASSPLPWFELAGVARRDVAPVIVMDAEVVRRVCDRPVLGLIGASAFEGLALAIDYEAGVMGLLAAADVDRLTQPVARPDHGEERVEPQRVPTHQRPEDQPSHNRVPKFEIALPFQLLGDDKILVDVRVRDTLDTSMGGDLRLVLDTGATQTALFPSALRRFGAAASTWPSVGGIAAPTLAGIEDARIMKVPEIVLVGGDGRSLDATAVRAQEVATLGGPLEAGLAAVVGEPVHGLLGYSFLRHFHVLIDYPRRTLWLARLAGPARMRPFEGIQPGLQLERRHGGIRISAVVDGSSADRAGARPGQRIVAVDGRSVAALDVIAVAHRLEGREGSRVRLRVREGGIERTLVMRRHRLP